MKRNSLVLAVILFSSVGITFAQTTVNFSRQNVVQNWTVPAGITTATITVKGAAGGGAANQGAGGNGASLTGVCTVTPGDVLSVVVASAGVGNESSWGSGGGGGSYVYDSNTITLLIAAGGGGGGGTTVSNSNGGPGGINIVSNVTTAGQGQYGDGAGGIGGNGGSPDSISDAAAGAGWISNGGNGSVGADGGNDRANLFTGGVGAGAGTYPNGGGYGGGGGGGNDGGGGGGGYNGGGGGSPGSGGGGGGSYLNGTVVGSPIANNTGDGYVSIEYGSINGINNFTFNPKTIQVYPNPSSGQFNVIVNVKLSMVNEMQVYNIMGQEISQFTINHSQFAIDLSTQSNGVYLYRVVVNDGSLMSEGKLVIQK